jgi:Protein of unknown function (DUF2510)
MDLPTSGWYPDPYGTPQLLRWWDGSTWTHHTHPDVSAGGGDAVTGVQATTVQPSTSTDRLNRTRPPSGPPTSPQPALPATAVQAAVQPTAVQSATVQPTTYQPAVTSVQPTTTVQPTPGQPPGLPGQGDGSSTQVLFTNNPWQSPTDSAWQAPGGVRAFGNPHGYAEAKRRRRRLLIGGLAVGTAAAIAVVGLIVANLGSSPSPASAADSIPATPTATPSATTSASPTVSPSPTASASLAGSVLSDDQSGLSYTALSAPWSGPGCPAALNNGTFTWTAGEDAVAGPVNGGQTTWYGEACSGPLPLQYGYNGVGALGSTAQSLATAFENSYYNTLAHNPATPQVSQPIQVSGHAAWEVTYQISYTNAASQGASWTDEQAAVVVVDTGAGNTPAVFFTSIPGNLDESNVASLVSSLQLSEVPSTSVSTSPANAGAPSDQASDQASDGSGGNNP